MKALGPQGLFCQDSILKSPLAGTGAQCKRLAQAEGHFKVPYMGLPEKKQCLSFRKWL
jgi:hypothetical protein